MKELEYLKIIKETLSDSSYLGDDCAFLSEFGLYVTQDTLVEDVHFKLVNTTPYELAQKSINVNLSDLASNGAKPLYVMVSLSLPNSIQNSFLCEFYKGINDCCNEYGIKVIGGDLTSAEKLYISICAIGKNNSAVGISRSFATVGDVVVTTGFHGDSAGGLNLLLNNKTEPEYLIKKHLSPIAQVKKSEQIIDAVVKSGVLKFAMMDTSDGLGDAIFKISQASNVFLKIDNIYSSSILKETFPDSWKDLAMWGGEDFELLFCVPQKVFDLLDKSQFYKIGTVVNQSLPKEFIYDFEHKSFKHFDVES